MTNPTPILDAAKRATDTLRLRQRIQRIQNLMLLGLIVLLQFQIIRLDRAISTLNEAVTTNAHSISMLAKDINGITGILQSHGNSLESAAKILGEHQKQLDQLRNGGPGRF